MGVERGLAPVAAGKGGFCFGGWLCRTMMCRGWLLAVRNCRRVFGVFQRCLSVPGCCANGVVGVPLTEEEEVFSGI